MTPSTTAHQLLDTLSVVEAVLQHVSRRLPSHISREDLASAGKVALIEALRRFTGPDREARAFCYARVRGAIFDELRRLDPLSRHTRTRVKTVNRATNALTNQLGREPADYEVAAATGLTIGDVRESNRIAVIEFCPLDYSSTGTKADLHDTTTPCPAEAAVQDDVALSVQAALDRLQPNQALTLRRYYLEDATLDMIALELGVSRERVRQIRVAGEKHLRADFIVLAQWQSLLVLPRTQRPAFTHR
ncbi:MAG: sigma-70 family RNA polymerase sigma factor [Cephaloticoccus sp.]|nr:sigma-70 family RNA polymerase sigma factor [Cephaloticoccus sp.]MCF7759206.1 sigma-70 family RNA polymerase sigma factor [Cephaloticoccus sp.]